MPDFIQMLSGLGEHEISCRGQSPLVAQNDIFTHPTGTNPGYRGPYNVPSSRWLPQHGVPPGVAGLTVADIWPRLSTDKEVVFPSVPSAVGWGLFVFGSAWWLGSMMGQDKVRRRGYSSRRSRR